MQQSSLMMIGLVIFAEALLIGQSVTAALTVPDSVKLGTIYRQGTCAGAAEISSSTGKTLKQCSETCSGVNNCVAFSWHETAGTCSLKADSCATPSTADAQSHFFDMLQFDFFHRPASDCSGGDLAYLTSKTLAYCLNWCRIRSSCKAAQWHSGLSNCYPKSLTCANADEGNPSNNFFDKTGSFDIVRGYTYSAGDCLGTNLLQLPRRTIKLCAWECTSRATCRSYVWTAGTGDCQLKSDLCTAAAAADKHMYVRIMTRSEAYDTLCHRVILNKLVLKSVKGLSSDNQTSGLEGFHSLVNQFSPKMYHFGYQPAFGWYPTDNTPPEFLYHLSTEAELPSTFTLVGKTKMNFAHETNLVCAHRCANAACALFNVSGTTCSIYTQ